MKEISFKELKPQTGCFNNIVELNLSSRKTTAYDEARIMKDAIKMVLSGASIIAMNVFVKEEYKKLEGLPEKQKSNKARELNKTLERFLNCELVKRAGMKEVLFKKRKLDAGDWKVEVNPDRVYKFNYVDSKNNTHEVYEAVIYKKGRKEMSKQGRSTYTNEKKSILLQSMIEYLKEEFPPEEGSVLEYKATVIYLKKKKGDNDCSEPYSESEHEAIMQVSSDEQTSFYENMKTFGLEPCTKTNCDKCSMKGICSFKYPPVKGSQKKGGKIKVSDVSLDPEQIKAVNAKEGIYRINAGAGVGKTLVLAIRIVELLESGAQPEKIMVTTFTNVGAEELRERVVAIGAEYGIEKSVVDKVNIMTLHSIGGMIIKDYYKELGYSEEPQIINEVQIVDNVLELIEKNPEVEELDYKNIFMNQLNYKGAVYELINNFEQIQGEILSREEYLLAHASEEKDEYYEAIYDIYEQYKELLVSKNLIEYSDQEDAAFKILEKHPDLFSKKYVYEHIMIDEFQDCSERQIMLATEMMSNPLFKSLMVVGDDNQAIFGFRHTSPKYLINFKKYIGYDDVEDIFISKNRRSTPEIIGLANKIVKLNKNRVKKELIATNPSGEKPILYGISKSADVYKKIAEKVQERILKGDCKESDICIIGRKKSSLLKIQSELSKLSISSTMRVKENIFDNSRVQALIALAKFFEQSDDTISLLTYLNTLSENELISCEKEVLVKLIESNVKEFKNIVESANEEELYDYFIKLAKAMDDDRDTIYKTFLDEVINHKAETVKEIASYIIKHETYNIKKEAIQEGSYDTVTLTTAHSSKGLEWPIVFVDISDFDNSAVSTYKDSEEVEEIRRLIFVCITRAKKELSLFSTKQIGSKNSPVFRPNRFYEEIKNFIGSRDV